MKILVTGAKGFVGKNLVAQLYNIKDNKARWYSLEKDLDILEYDKDNTPEDLEKFCKDCDAVVHLAGVNRPKKEEEFMQGNFSLLETLLCFLKKHKNSCPIILSSSIQAELDNPYGKSKLAGEELLIQYSLETNTKIKIYRFANVFGKWCRPNYNSVVATFCNNIANDLEIKINDENAKVRLVYIDDVVDGIIGLLSDKEWTKEPHAKIEKEYQTTVGELAKKIYSFKEIKNTLVLPDVADEFTKKLYSTFLSYLPAKEICYPLKMNVDERGSFTEVFKSNTKGQVSVNVSRPGYTKGEHWHNTKAEKFIVVKGSGIIRMRRIGKDEQNNDYPVLEYNVDDKQLMVVNMIPGYTHNITNLSKEENLVFLIWANETFDEKRPDTYFEKVNKD